LSVFAAFSVVSLLFDFTTLVYFDIWPLVDIVRFCVATVLVIFDIWPLVDIVRFCVGTYPLIDPLFKLLFW